MQTDEHIPEDDVEVGRGANDDAAYDDLHGDKDVMINNIFADVEKTNMNKDLQSELDKHIYLDIMI